jgi:TRAP-type mannitol/chloroaromatic compound transport system permease small subunit
LNRGHVNMDILYSRLPARGKAIMNVGTGVFFLVFCFVLVWKSGFMAWESVKYKEVFTQSVWEPPLYPIKIVFFLGCLLLTLQGVAKFIRDLILVSKPGKGTGNG